jgi:hypothetical protein
MEHDAKLYLFPRSWQTKCDSMAVNNDLSFLAKITSSALDFDIIISCTYLWKP